jgi:hypothetical protein
MKFLLSMLAILFATFGTGVAGEKVLLYARLTEGVMVDLSDGSKWQMDKGDCFPVIAYKEAHTKLVLQLAGANFMVPTAKTQIVPEKEHGDAIAKYRANVNTYLNGYANRWKNDAAAPKPGDAVEPKKSE